jgi:hypothetical protein
MKAVRLLTRTGFDTGADSGNELSYERRQDGSPRLPMTDCCPDYIHVCDCPFVTSSEYTFLVRRGEIRGLDGIRSGWLH